MARKYWSKIVKYFSSCEDVFYGLFDYKFNADIEKQKRVYVTDGHVCLYVEPAIYERYFVESDPQRHVFKPLDEKNNGFRCHRSKKEIDITKDNRNLDAIMKDICDDCSVWMTTMLFDTKDGNLLRVFRCNKRNELIAVNNYYQELAEDMEFYNNCSLTGSVKYKPIRYEWFGQGMFILPVHFDVQAVCKGIVEMR